MNPGNGENIPPGEHVRYKIERYMNITQTFRKNPSQTAVFIGDDLPDGGYEISRSPNTLIIIDKTSGEQEQITIQPGDALRFRDTLKRYHRQN